MFCVCSVLHALVGLRSSLGNCRPWWFVVLLPGNPLFQTANQIRPQYCCFLQFDLLVRSTWQAIFRLYFHFHFMFALFAWPDSRRFFSTWTCTWTCTFSLNLPWLVVVWIKIGRKDSFGLRPFVQKAHCTQLHTKCYISRRLDHSPPNSRSAFKLWTFLLFNWLLLYIDLSWTDLLCIALYPLYAVPQLHIALYPAYAVPYGSNRPNLLPRSHYHRPYHQ